MTEAEHTALAGRSLVLYDGVCGLCNRIVQLLLRIDRRSLLRFTPLQSPLGAEMLSRFPTSPAEPEGVVLIADALTPREAIYRRFDAVGESLLRLEGPYPLFGHLLRLVPRFLRKWVYGLIARSRYRLFGKLETCPVPTADQRSRILGV